MERYVMTVEPLSRFEERARLKGIAEASADLLVVARSLTVEEVRVNDARIAMICFGVYAMFALLLTVAALASFPLWAAPAPLLLAVPIGLLARARARRRIDYRDPGVVVTVGHDGVRIRDATRSDTSAYSDLAVVRIIYHSSRNMITFLGVEVDTPLGPLTLQDGWFKDGTRAAAMILRQLDERNVRA